MIEERTPENRNPKDPEIFQCSRCGNYVYAYGGKEKSLPELHEAPMERILAMRMRGEIKRLNKNMRPCSFCLHNTSARNPHSWVRREWWDD